MKKLLSLVLALSLVAALFVGCGQEEPAAEVKEAVTEAIEAATEGEMKDTYTIGVAGSSFADKWMTYLYDAIEASAAEMGNIEIILTDGKDDSSTQLANVENMIIQGVDAIVLIIVDPTGAKPFIKVCEDAGVPLVGVNRIFEGATTYVGSESIDAGLMQMEWVAEELDGKGQIVVLQGAPGHEAAEKRTEGNEQIVANYPDMEIIRMDTGKWDRAKGMEITENWLQSGDDIAAIVANNDEMAIGAIRALEAAGIADDDMIVAGIDATIDALEYVKTGELDVTVFQSPFAQGEQGLIAAVKLIKGEAVDAFVNVPFELVTSENVDEYIAKWQ